MVGGGGVVTVCEGGGGAGGVGYIGSSMKGWLLCVLVIWLDLKEGIVYAMV